MMTKYVVWSTNNRYGKLLQLQGNDDLKFEVQARLSWGEWVHVVSKVDNGYVHHLYIPDELGRWELLPTVGKEIMELLEEPKCRRCGRQARDEQDKAYIDYNGICHECDLIEDAEIKPIRNSEAPF